MIGRACDTGKIGAQQKTGRTVRQHRYPALRPQFDLPGRSPGFMMPWAVAAFRDLHIPQATTTRQGGR